MLSGVGVIFCGIRLRGRVLVSHLENVTMTFFLHKLSGEWLLNYSIFVNKISDVAFIRSFFLSIQLNVSKAIC